MKLTHIARLKSFWYDETKGVSRSLYQKLTKSVNKTSTEKKCVKI